MLTSSPETATVPTFVPASLIVVMLLVLPEYGVTRAGIRKLYKKDSLHSDSLRRDYHENFIADTAAFFPIEPLKKHNKSKDSPYTEEEIDTIIELHKEGMTPTKIGTIIGRNAGAIFMKIKKLTAEGRI